MFFVFAAMMEFAVLLVVKRKMDGMKIKPEIEKGDSGTKLRKAEMIPENQKERNTKKSKFFESLAITNKVDFVAFFMFILGFFVFNCIYWKQNIQDFNI